MADQANSIRDELNRVLATRQEQLPQVAPVPSTHVAPIPATQPLAASLPSASLATAPMPSVPVAAALPSAFQAQALPLASQAIPPAFQAQAPPLASQAIGHGPFAVPAYISPAIRNPDGTISRRMDQVDNNVIVTFSGDDEMASKRAKLFGSSAKYDIFTGQDMSKFPKWVAQFLSGVNLFQPTEPNACKIALHLLRDKAAEMSKNVSQQVTMQNLQELLTALDRIFNTSGNRIVVVGLFNSFAQREDMSVQDYAIGIEQLFY